MDKAPVDVASVREASCREHAEIRRLLRAAYAGYASTVAAEVFPVYLADVLDLSADGATVLVALDGRAIVGTARLHVRLTSIDLPAGAAYVRGVAVRPDREGGGIARASGAVVSGARGATAVRAACPAPEHRTCRGRVHCGRLPRRPDSSARAGSGDFAAFFATS